MNIFRQRWLALGPWLRWTLVVMFYLTLIGGMVIWQYQRPGGATLYVHNHTDRPIFSYWVNDNWGGNAGANGGGKTTCCWRIGGNTLKVVWILDVTPEQLAAGLTEERLETNIINPNRQRSDKYLHVHFFPENKVRLAWSPNHDSPYER